MENTKCHSCGAKNNLNERYCFKCGVMINPDVPHDYSASAEATAMKSAELEEANSNIRSGYTAGFISVGLSLVFLLFTMGIGLDISLALPVIASIVIVFGLSVGVFFKSRACAVLLLAFYALDKMFTLAVNPKAVTIILSLVFIYLFYKGVKGTFAYHNLVKA